MILKQMLTGPLDVNCYILGCEKTREAAVIDPGGNGEEIKELLDKLELKIKWILITHGHFDHTGGIKKLKQLTDGEIAIHEKDLFLLNGGPAHAQLYGFEIDKPPVPEKLLKDNELINMGEYSIKVIHTPGHSPGGLSYYVEDKIFVGDVLFERSIGRTDLPGGDYNTLIGSIKEKIFSLPEDTIVYPGHGPYTNIYKEIRENPFLKSSSVNF